jgi:UDP-N-acetylglucosamine acyltransferase
MIHPTAIIEDGARISVDVQIGAYAVIKAGTCLAAGVRVHEHAVLGGDPQDHHFDPATASGVEVGPGVVIREGVTIHRATRPGTSTRIGEAALLMANSHVGHDCCVGQGATLANGVLLGGFVQVGAGAFLGGNAVFHQWVRLGQGAIVSGGSRIAHDVPPFIMAEGYSRAAGLNLIGLKRSNTPSEAISELKQCYRAVFFHSGNPAQLAINCRPKTEQGRAFVEFFKGSQRGFVKSRIRLSAR